MHSKYKLPLSLIFPTRILTFKVSALWCRYCFGETERGDAIESNDPSWDYLHATSKLAKTDPLEWLRMEHIYGPLSQSKEFGQIFRKTLVDLWQFGTEKMLFNYVNEN